MSFPRLYRRMVLSIAGNPLVYRTVRRYGLKLGVLRFIAGETMEDGLRVSEELTRRGLHVTLANLGEGLKTREDIEEDFRVQLTLLEEIGRRPISGHISVKVSRLGIDISPDLCVEHLEQLVDKAKEVGSFVRINMEEFYRVQQTLDAFYEVVSKRGVEHLGVVIQTGLRRSRKDIEDLIKVKANVRLVKGSFNESAEIAFPSKADVDDNYYHCGVMLLEAGCYTAFATHDEKLINRLKEYIRKNNIPTSQFEWQMLYGIRPDLQTKLAQEGHTSRVYVPFGSEWYAFFSRRLSERPENIVFVLKNLLRA